jgi:hypothetical protein
MNPLHVLAAHRHLALIEVTISTPLIQNLFIFKADEKNPSSSSLTASPLCTKALFGDPQPRSRRGVSKAIPRCMYSMSLGLWIDDKEEFVVAELTVDVHTQGRTRTKAAADICFLRSSFPNCQAAGSCEWDTIRAKIPSATADDLWKFSHWQTDAAIPFRNWLCWVDYHQGILFWDVLNPAPTYRLLLLVP